MKSVQRILVLRFSAMGDVVLLVPVLRSLVAAHPRVHITVATRPRYAAFFTGIDRVSVFEADVDLEYAGFFGLRDLFRDLFRRGDFDFVIDLHDHVRTMVIRSLFKLFGEDIVVFDKGRHEKKAFTRKENKITDPLPHTVDRYKAVFEKAGFTFPMLPPPYLLPPKADTQSLEAWLMSKQLEKKETWIGIAPFSMHLSKIWPLENYQALLEILTNMFPVKFFFFGGGDEEIEFFNSLAEKFPKHSVVAAGILKIQEEIALIQKLDLMLCVDSSNMHLAVLSGAPVLSLWGGTHPDVGFGPYQQNEQSVLQISRTELPCRPCSVYGKETCLRGDFACMHWIKPEAVAERISGVLRIGQQV